MEGVLISAYVKCLSNETLSDEREESRLLMAAGMFFVVTGGLLLSRCTYCRVMMGFV